jgi:predicted DNA-binding antitoxin AbrB/MazE fold protein
MGMGTKVIAIYRDGVLKPIEKLNLPEKAKVRITISGNFSKLLDEVGEIEAKGNRGEGRDRQSHRKHEDKGLLWIEPFWILRSS